jgi:voltage-gated potassium channel
MDDTSPEAPTDPAPITDEVAAFRERVRSPADLQRLSDYSRRAYVPLVLSALLPIITAVGRAGSDSGLSIVVNIAAWLVFLVDLLVHMRFVKKYLRTRSGRIDLFIVILTAPWFLIPGFSSSEILVLARLARLVRLLFVSKGARRAGRQVGRVGLVALGMLLFGSWMAFVAEEPTNPEFAHFTDALWWGIVTLTTVGYGDIVPITAQGRRAGVLLMLTGVATLGLIAGSLASAFGFGDSGATSAPPPTPSPEPNDVGEQIAALRRELHDLGQLLGADRSDPPPDT